MLLGVTGKPILHSLSPTLHRACMKSTGVEGQYIRLAANSAKEALILAKEIGLSGLNITAPFKEEMAQIVSSLDPSATETKAVNTIVFKDSDTGFNTDIDGVLGALDLSESQLRGKKVLVIGAGGAALAAIVALKKAGGEITIVNRSEEKAKTMAELFAVKTAKLSSLDVECVSSEVIINTVPTDDAILSPKSLLGSKHLLEASYAHESYFLRAAREAGVSVISGREWLLYQGIKAFELFTEKKPSLGLVRSDLQKADRILNQTITLIGMMGSGKSSIGKELASQLNREWIDLDSNVEKKAGLSISQLIKQKGEAAFREIESSELRAALAHHSAVISCGGGAVLNEGNRKLLKQLSTPIWLWASAQELESRLKSASDRPLLGDEDRLQRLKDLLVQRRDLYANASSLVVNTVGYSAKSIADRILYEIRYCNES